MADDDRPNYTVIDDLREQVAWQQSEIARLEKQVTTRDKALAAFREVDVDPEGDLAHQYRRVIDQLFAQLTAKDKALEAFRKYVRIHDDAVNFDGDRRGHWEAFDTQRIAIQPYMEDTP